MSKKVIEQIKVVKYFGKGEKEPTVIDNPSASELTTVAKAICPEYQKVEDERDKLQAFKDYVHKRLDDAGIEKNPIGEHSKAGCRIGDRLDLVFDRNAKLVEALREFNTYLTNRFSMLRQNAGKSTNDKSKAQFQLLNEISDKFRSLQNTKKIEG